MKDLLKKKIEFDLIEIFSKNSEPFSRVNIMKIKSLLDDFHYQLDPIRNKSTNKDLSLNDISIIILEVISILRPLNRDSMFSILEMIRFHINHILLECSKQRDMFIFDPKTHQIGDYLHHSFSNEFACVHIKGDGNCLWNSISFSLFGDYSFMESLRLLTASTLVEYKTEFTEHLNNQKVKYGYNHDLTFEELITAATELSVWGDEYHILALSIALQRPIFSYGSFLTLIGEKEISYNQLKYEYEKDSIPNHMRYVGNSDDKYKRPLCIHYNGENHYSAILPIRKNSDPLVPKMKIFDYVIKKKLSRDSGFYI